MRIVILIVLPALLLLAACGESATRQADTPTPAPTSTPAPTNTPTPTSVAEEQASAEEGDVISAAIAAMQQVESFHAEVDAAFKVVQTEASFRMDEETFGTVYPVRFSGDFQMPDRASGKLQVSLGLVAIEMDIITIGDIAYIADPRVGAWEQYPLIYTGLPSPYEFAIPPADPRRYTDVQVSEGETLNGMNTRHVRANLRASVLGSAYDNLFVEMWIGQEDNLIHRLTMAGETSVDDRDAAGLAGSALGAGDIGGKAEFIMTINYSNFNQPIAIEAPIP